MHEHLRVAPAGAFQESNHDHGTSIVSNRFIAALQLLDHGFTFLFNQGEDLGEAGQLLHEHDTETIVPVLGPIERQQAVLRLRRVSTVVITPRTTILTPKLGAHLEQPFELICKLKA